MAKAKLKIPKEVAGVRLPKELRREAKRALKLADSPTVRELAVAGLTIAAQAVLDKARTRRTRSDSASSRPAAAARPADLDILELGDMLRAAAMEGARRFLEGFDEGQAVRPAAAASPGVAPKPKARARPKSKKATARRPAGVTG
ncbi:hypothetical protein RCO27_08060 [Sphingosinicella sp. LHD-64]|uniref:hypothetical protein n=1 Tax=Sphingosinicella sp. LHD-64 TaxID=3072139 RepID=UPI00280E5095|nr:hypothetical protein [Sphingosinicella sp. LHD-64]MDQ8756185.1 hypothetical protein [Sphingosinicella sp. LHD-64]